MIRRAVAALLLAAAVPAGAQTFAISGGTVALGDGSEPIPNGMVVVRDGKIVAAGDVRMKLPDGTQVTDATGKWVTPGIVAGFSGLGLSNAGFGAEGGADTKNEGPFNAAIDVVPAINPLAVPVAVNRADGVTRMKSPSRMPRPIMLSPLAFRKKTSSLGRKRRSTVMKPFRCSGIRWGSPA